MNKLMREQTIVPIILCGGSGSRLWPASRQDHPKQFLNIIGEHSLLQNTLLRAKRLPGVTADRIVIVTTAAMEQEVSRQAEQLDPNLIRHIIVEPCSRNTAPAIALATAYCLERFGPEIMLCIMPSDHHIAQEKTLQDSFSTALTIATDTNIITFGIAPSGPSTEYGYIITDKDSRKVIRFKEKPGVAEAQSLIDSGTAYWNSGIFLLSLKSSLHHFRAYSPSLYNDIIKSTISIKNAYTSLDNLSFDHEIMEKSDNLLVVPSDLQWTDIGSWESLWNIHPKDNNGNVLIGKTACLDSEGCFIQSHKRLIATSGLKDIVVVETEDAIFVSSKKDANIHRKLANAVQNVSQGPWSMTGRVGPEYLVVTHDHDLLPQETMAFYVVLEGEADLDGKTYQNHDLIVFHPGEKSSIKSTGSIPLKLLKVSMNGLLTKRHASEQENRHVS